MFPGLHRVPLLVLVAFIPVISPIAVSFDRSGAHSFLSIETPSRQPQPQVGSGFSIRLDLRTNERDGLILSVGSPTALSMALELFNSRLFAVVALANGRYWRQRLSETSLSDGRLHSLNLTLSMRSQTLAAAIDGAFSQKALPHAPRTLHDGPHNLFLGWHPNASALPKELYSGTLHRPFRGCVENLVVNEQPIDLEESVGTDTVNAAVSFEDSCAAVPLEQLCLSRSAERCPACAEGWRRTLCDCAFGVCDRQASLTFDPTAATRRGTTLYSWTMRHDEVTELAVRFSSLRPDGLLLAATGADSLDSLYVRLERGKLVIQSDLGNGTRVCVLSSHI